MSRRDDHARYEADVLLIGERAARALKGENTTSGMLTVTGRARRRRHAITNRVTQVEHPPSVWSDGIDWFTCVYCGRHTPGERMTKDHVVPLGRGGANGVRNIVPACGPCNHGKADQLPSEWRTDVKQWHPLVQAALDAAPKTITCRLPPRRDPLTWEPFANLADLLEPAG